MESSSTPTVICSLTAVLLPVVAAAWRVNAFEEDLLAAAVSISEVPAAWIATPPKDEADRVVATLAARDPGGRERREIFSWQALVQAYPPVGMVHSVRKPLIIHNLGEPAHRSLPFLPEMLSYGCTALLLAPVSGGGENRLLAFGLAGDLSGTWRDAVAALTAGIGLAYDRLADRTPVRRSGAGAAPPDPDPNLAAEMMRIMDSVPAVMFQLRVSPANVPVLGFMSRGAVGLFEVTEPELVTDDMVFRLVHPEEQAEVKASIIRAHKSGSPWEHDFRIVTKNGAVRWIRASASFEQQAADGTSTWNGIFTDISLQRKEEILRQHTEDRYRKLFTRALDGIVIYDQQTFRVLDANPAAQRLYGYTRDEFLQRSSFDLLSDEPDDASDADAMGNSQQFTFVVHRKKDGGTFPAGISIGRFNLGDRPCMFMVVRDVTAQRQAAHELRAAKLAAEDAALSKAQFLANMSHEIRTPLNSIIMTSRLFQDEELTEEQQRLSHIISRAGESLLHLLNNILDLSKIESGKIRLHEEPFELSVLIEDCLAMFRPAVDAKSIRLEFEMQPGVPNHLRGDPQRLRQIFINLIGNAVKFTKEGKVRVNVKRGRNDKVLFIEVIDSGVGISPAKLKSVFESFSPATDATSRQFGGTGLGLAITRRLVRLLGGEIDVESAVGLGSRFWFTLPVVPAAPGDSAAVQTTKAGAKRNMPFIAPANGGEHHERILLVEDNPSNQWLASLILKKMHYDVDTASNGEEAVDMVTRFPYPVILMDCQMPILDGYDATRLIRAMEREKGRRTRSTIIALTAFALDGDREKCLEAGMDDYVTKPLDPVLLGRKLAEARGAVHSRAQDEVKSLAQAQSVRTFIDGLRAEVGVTALQQVLELFLETLGPLVDAMSDESVPRRDLAMYLHKLAGTSGSIGARDLMGLCRRAEAALKIGDEPELAATRKILARDGAQVLGTLREIHSHFERAE